MAKTVTTQASLDPNAPEFIPPEKSLQSLIPCVHLSHHHFPLPPPPLNPVFSYPYFRLNVFQPHIHANNTLHTSETSLSLISSSLPPQDHKNLLKLSTEGSAKAVGRQKGNNGNKYSRNKYWYSRRESSGDGSEKRKVVGKGHTSSCRVEYRKVGGDHCDRECRNIVKWSWAGKERKNKNDGLSNVLAIKEDGNDTTVMIRNIPSKYTRELLLEFLDEHCMKQNKEVAKTHNNFDVEEVEDKTLSAYDFFYLPIDFNTRMNKGYAFVNFTTPKSLLKFYADTNNQKWDLFQSHKIRQVALARLQGKEQLVRHFENMGFPCESEEVLPVYFSPPRDGSREAEVKQITVGTSLGRHRHRSKDALSLTKCQI